MSLTAPALSRSGRPAAVGLVRAEVLAMLKLALPLAATQLAQMAINTTDVLLLGWLGPEFLAAASLGLALFYFLFLVGLGVVSGTAPLFAQMIGANEPRRVRQLLQAGLVVVLLVSLPLMAVAAEGRPILLALGQDPDLLARTEPFLLAMLWSLPGMLGVVLLRSFTTAFGTARPVLAATLLSLPVNAVLAYGLIFGRLGLPALGIVGSGIASAAAHTTMFATVFVWCAAAPRFRRHLLPLQLKVEPSVVAEILKVGLPISGAQTMETGLFMASGLLMGLFGALPLAAHQVTLQLCATSFMVPLGIGLAATVRVGIAHGAGNAAAARRAGLVACAAGGGLMLGAGLLFWFGGHQLVRLFLDTSTAEGATTALLAASLLRVGAFFQLFDALQVTGISSLRGLGDTRIPMALAALGYWAVGFPTAALLSRATPLGPLGVWIGLAAALAVVALAMLVRFEWLTGRRLRMKAAG